MAVRGLDNLRRAVSRIRSLNPSPEWPLDGISGTIPNDSKQVTAVEGAGETDGTSTV